MHKLIITVSTISLLAAASTTILYLHTRDASKQVVLSRALDRANAFALAARTTNVDDGVLARMAKLMQDETAVYACVYSLGKTRLCEEPPPASVAKSLDFAIDRVAKKKRYFSQQIDSGRTVLWFPVSVGTGALGLKEPIGGFGPGPHGDKTRVLTLVVDDGSSRWLMSHSTLHAALMALLLLTLVLLTVRQLKTMSKQQEMERAMGEQRRFAEVGRLSAVLAHEIRNPLGAIKGFAQYAAERHPGDETLREDMDTVVTESSRLERLVQSLLSYARPKQQLHLVSTPVGDLLHRVARLAGAAAQEKEVILETSASSPGDISAELDAEQMLQALLNITINAVDASGEGQTVSLGFQRDEEHLIIEVRDQGEGIDPAMLERIFEPYVTEKKASGTGLGLAVALRTTKAHGGRIEVDSRPGHGSVFRIILPLS